MDRKEAIKWLGLLRKLPVSWDDYSEKTANIRRAAEQKEREAIDMAIKVLKEQEWNPVSESPKQEKKEYLVQTDMGYICVCRWTNVNLFQTDLTTDWHWHIMDVPQYSKVVAWMEKPELYKPESEDKE